MSVDAKTMAAPAYRTGRFTSAGTAAAVTETLGFTPTLVQVWLDIDAATSPNMYTKMGADANETLLTTGTTGIVTRVADASAVLLTSAGFTVAAAAQANNGVNSWIAFR